MLYRFEEHHPTFLHGPDESWQGWIADSASVIGQVELGQKSSVWFGAVIRADNHKISIGYSSNIQENAVLHTDYGVALSVADWVTVGHQAMLHGCTIGNGCLIGINAVILNGAVIGEHCIIGANSLIPEGKIIPPFSVVMGSPGKVVKPMTDALVQRNQASALHYAAHAQRFRQGLRPFLP